jgi:formate-dependent nitrite reductase cytochrome c552 subunit
MKTLLKTACLAAVWLTGPMTEAAGPKPPAHAPLDCATCHDAALIEKFKQLQARLGKDIEPGWDRVREEIPLGGAAMQALAARCADCHAQQAKDWASSGHAMTCAQSFLNREHNRMEPPMDDCLRCHAMFFEGTARDLVTPLDTRGPWRMVHKEVGDHRAIPCVVCHQVHPEKSLVFPSPSGAPAKLLGDGRSSKAGFYDRRERRFFPAHELPHPKIFDGGKRLPVSDDARIRICVQCHAPSAAHQAGTSDDRTLRGVHEGMSCLDCHATHSLDTRASCAQCHPAASSCGLDVTRMDTTARAKASRHDIHTVACRDCHPHGDPKRKR